MHGVWTDQATGYLEWWIDGMKVGRTDGVTSEIGGRHFWKGGITRATGPGRHPEHRHLHR